MDVEKSKLLFGTILNEIESSPNVAATTRFPSLRAVDAKVREVKIIIRDVQGIPPDLLRSMESDDDFQANSRRVRLETLAHYVRSSLRFLESGIYRDSSRKVLPPPDFHKLAQGVPGLCEIFKSRWIEAQRCINAECYLSAVILLGSILEALLLARATLDPGTASRANAAPKRNGVVLKIHEWKLSGLIDVSVEVGWIKLDRGKFSHALRESRNLVHPYAQAQAQDFPDKGTCATCWQVVNAALDDLLASMAN